jgi:hypothetical protein
MLQLNQLEQVCDGVYEVELSPLEVELVLWLRITNGVLGY